MNVKYFFKFFLKNPSKAHLLFKILHHKQLLLANDLHLYYNNNMEKCDPKKLLKSGNIKITSQRISILNEIIKLEKPFNANDLYVILKNKIDLATIYRVFGIFKESGIIREVAHKGDVLYYELSCIHHPVHPHFICDNCRSIICLKELQSKDSTALSRYTKELTVRDISINFNGLCKKCKGSG